MICVLFFILFLLWFMEILRNGWGVWRGRMLFCDVVLKFMRLSIYWLVILERSMVFFCMKLRMVFCWRWRRLVCSNGLISFSMSYRRIRSRKNSLERWFRFMRNFVWRRVIWRWSLGRWGFWWRCICVRFVVWSSSCGNSKVFGM